jgi:hypothetical protein
MKFPSIYVSCTKKRQNDLPDYIFHYYNNHVFTNKTIKKPYYCPKGRKNCSMCRTKLNGNFNKEKPVTKQHYYDENFFN